MKINLCKRNRNGWGETVIKEVTVAEYKEIRDKTRKLLRERRQAILGKNPDASWEELIPYHCTKVGEVICNGGSGTLTELHHAGVCIGCLGTGREQTPKAEAKRVMMDDGKFGVPCDFCKGSGDNESI